MKAVIRDYLASLREREELDAILPDLLSALGFNVISRPRRGTTQRGVDVAAIGEHQGERKLFLFSVKPGDLNRAEWNGPQDQALRPSLDEILDGYLHTKVSPRFRDLKVVICLCIGGEIREDVSDLVAGYMAAKRTPQVDFEEWNGDRMAELLLSGILREAILPEAQQSSFRKAVAMVDEPDVAYRHFLDLVRALRAGGGGGLKDRLRLARQIYLAVWVLFVWGRDADNVEAAYQASEVALLHVWDLRRTTLASRSAAARDLHRVVQQMIQLHLLVASELLETKVMPHTAVQDGLSMAVAASNSIDVNLKLFDLLGRIGLLGLWIHWLSSGAAGPAPKTSDAAMRRFLDAGFDLIQKNPALQSPITDAQVTDIQLFLQFWLARTPDDDRAALWVHQLAFRLIFTLRMRSDHPITSGDYRDLVEHPRDRSDEGFAEATRASVLIPVLSAWLASFGLREDLEHLADVVAAQMEHCSLQLWLPDATSEAHLYVNDEPHGTSLMDLAVEVGGERLVNILQRALEAQPETRDLSAVRENLWPIAFVAFRHYRWPVPPQFWAPAMNPLLAPDESGAGTSE